MLPDPRRALRSLALGLALAPAGVGPSFEVRFTPEALPELADQGFTGRVLVYLSKTSREPRTDDNPARLEPVASALFEGVAAGEPMVLDGRDAAVFPVPLADLEGGTYFAQAVVDAAGAGPTAGRAAGNAYSASQRVELHPGASPRIAFVCDRRVASKELTETRWSKLFELRSERLSRFRGQAVSLRALVHLPEAWYAEPERRFPLQLVISGYGASIEEFEFVDWPAPPLDGEPTIAVYLDPSCPAGHCGFADSDNNGPWGSALVEELLPALEEAYRGVGAPPARWLVGHSSGGWAALWLMVRHPEEFGYAWAMSPDPVDFRDFMGVDLYAPGANLFRDEAGDPRPFCRIGQSWTIGYTREYADRERVVGGGVLHSFEALFGPRGADDLPEPLFDRRTGGLRPSVVRAWSRFDIGRLLRERWEELGPRLAGRVAITIGRGDNFLLQGSVALLERDLARRGADVRVHLVPGDHFSVPADERGLEQVRAMVSVYRAWLAEHGGADATRRARPRPARCGR